MLDKIISYSFYLLFFLVPLFWTSFNYELFEYNKMILVYGFTVIIVGTWILKMINDQRLTIKRTPLDIPLLLFLAANILSTIFSIDPHTSIWGYYSRSNGGLLSLISYLFLYWAFVSNMGIPQVKKVLKFGLASGLIISLWAISEHFGASPSCLILRGEFNDACWIQDVQARVFASLGQPNWLAAYLSMLIFPAFYFFLTATKKSLYILHFTLLIIFYLAFTFTYSRGPTLGLIGGMIVFLLFYFKKTLMMAKPDAAKKYGAVERTLYLMVQKLSGAKQTLSERTGGASGFLRTGEPIIAGPQAVLLILVSFLIINLLFGSALTGFRLVSKFAAPARPEISLPTASSGTQLENGGTESGQIRFIVWRGALDIFLNYPIFGSGLETFAYSYYRYRPIEHNLTSEWDFLYNKAHNEYLNYLATTGIVGFGAYSIIIITFITIILKKLKTGNLLILSLLASYISYLIYNFFLFSVVIIAVFFYLFPALTFVATESTKPLKISSTFHFLSSIFRTIYHRPLYTKITKGIVVILTVYFLYSIFQLWYADTLFAEGQRASEAGNPGRAYNLLSTASELNKSEPFYKSELGFATAQAAASLQYMDATLSAELKNEAIFQTEEVLRSSPKNVSFLRAAVRTYFELSSFDQTYADKTLQTLDSAIKLAPTDPKLYYNKALVLDTMGRKEEEVSTLQEAIKLKPNYLEALTQLKEATASAK
ncbi:MAG: O-antigen ligase family protein [Candidatus Daviesbacteria bacterium]|nr:O-antigen ligase family protein [Candidatus Daviesbacteria bacterium]